MTAGRGGIPDMKPPSEWASPFPNARALYETAELRGWLKGAGGKCASAAEFLLKSETMFGLGEDWYAEATERGFPLAGYVCHALAVDLIRNTKIFDWSTSSPGPDGFRKVFKTLLDPRAEPRWQYEMLEAWFEKAFRARTRITAGQAKSPGEA